MVFWAGFSVAADPAKGGERYLRFQAGGVTSYGVLEADRVRRLSGDLFGAFTKTEQTYAPKEVSLFRPPCRHRCSRWPAITRAT
jgi:hypothetical protein